MPFVVKYGGNAMTEPAIRRAVAGVIREWAQAGEEPVVVHGGGPFIKAELDRRGVSSSFVRGLRVTTEAVLEAAEAALTLLGKDLAQEIGDAVALTGRDSATLLATVKDPELGRVGSMVGVNEHLLRTLLSARFTPVIACLAVDGDGHALNVNADEVAGYVAGALTSPVLFMTDVPGVLDNPANPASLLATLDDTEVRQRISDGRIAGGMIPKVEAALAALDAGASWARITDGRDVEAIRASRTGGAGTLIKRA